MKKITKAILHKRAKRKAKREAKNLYKQWIKEIKEANNYCCQISGKCFKNAKPQALQAAHILSKENYPEMKTNLMNGITLSFHHHKNSPISPHLDGFAFSLWLAKHRPLQYEYLKNYLETKNPEMFKK